MCHPQFSNELFEILCEKLRSIVQYYSRPCHRIFPLFPFQNHFYISLCHRFSNLMVNDIAATAIQTASKIIESTLDIQIGNINMTMLMESKWLHKTGSFFALLFSPMPD